ncbi:cytochrome c oxidase subunit 2A [Paenibacillus hexagrammi]|uniref:Cytochrome c oxidase subunit 2A n=1 Tax=Paenibacillus hexagrammi TaxID=2908839 RepID=A0ABY3SJ31_9BACL|nr:cytochrome c oxidase subunit 2A [Paenibacillus sp. YPD9-1]UJF33813.1 cytochrome c oxidase subunit 2A [Paenibacillus sp. YPD9-1]
MNSQRRVSQGTDRENGDKEPVLSGTFAAVLLLGLFLVGSWGAVFILFLSRQ